MNTTQSYKNCQSCGMPLNKDKKGGGTNADGTRSAMYCSHCFEDGKFVLPDINVEEMRERVKDRLKQMRFHKFFAGFFTRGIYKLERWKK